MAFADTLKKLMDVREMKAVDLARATGLSEAAISGYLKGTKEPRGKQSVEIAKALNVPLDILWETDFAPESQEISEGLVAFGDRLREARLQKGLTQEQLAKKIGVAKFTLTGYEKGNCEPDVFKIKKILEVLEADSDYLLGIDRTKKSPEPDATDSEDEKEKDEIVKVLTEGLSRLGFLDKDGMISDRDFKFLCSLVDLMLAHFNQED